MKIHKLEVILISACAVAGFIFLLFPTHGNVTAAIVAGIPSGALGGCLWAPGVTSPYSANGVG